MREDEVDLWHAALDDAADLTLLLDGAERAGVAALRAAADRRRATASRGLRRRLLAGYLAVPPERLRFRAGPAGKPELDPPDLAFSVAHSGGRAVFAVTAGRPVGVDLERVRPLVDLQALAEEVLAGEELAAWRARPADTRERAFFDAWTAKEAFVKATGTGLDRPLREVPLAVPHPWARVRLELGPACAGALVARGHGWRLRDCGPLG